MPNLLFVRIWWMRFYNGSIPGDERPIGGGRYNAEGNTGGEVYNFRNTDGQLYGYYQPPMNAHGVNLARISPDGIDNYRSEVLVVMVATDPEQQGQYIVGWYSNAKIYRESQDRPGNGDLGANYYFSAQAEDCVLLPNSKRNFAIPSGAGGFGQANVCYPLEANGQPRNFPWMKNAIKFIKDYSGDNILINPVADAVQETVDSIETALCRSQGQGFARNAEQRRSLELHAMDKAKRHFRRKQYRVEDVSATHPYDLICSNNEQTLHVEVKGTTTDGRTVVLTRNEVLHASDERHNCILFIVHSMTLNNGQANGGVIAIIDPWHPKDNDLTPISYTYRRP